MANVRELNRKVSSLRNMQKVMSAMNMISTTKLQRILGRYAALVSFEKGALKMAHELVMASPGSKDPLVAGSDSVKKVCVVLFTSDKGLCGSHNNSVQRAAAKLIKSMMKDDVEVDVVCIGTRGASFCRRNDYEINLSTDSSERELKDAGIHEITRKLIARVVSGEVQQVHFVYNAFISTLQQSTNTVQVLPFDSLLPKKLPEELPRFTVESGDDDFVDVAGERIFYYLLKSVLRHSQLSEHASRMTAMDNASKNSEDLINRYGAIRNRARQATITSELSEIVAGKEALK